MDFSDPFSLNFCTKTVNEVLICSLINEIRGRGQCRVSMVTEFVKCCLKRTKITKRGRSKDMKKLHRTN